MLHLGGTVSADNKAAGKQCIARPFYNGVGFTRKQGLVDLAFPCYHNGVGTNLVAGGQQQNIIQDDLFYPHMQVLAAPHDSGFWGGDQGELVDGTFGTDALEGANDGVGNDDAHKQGVPVRAHQDDGHGQKKVQDVEKGDQVFTDDLPFRFRLDAGVAVVKALLYSQLDLFRGESCFGSGMKSLNTSGVFGAAP